MTVERLPDCLGRNAVESARTVASVDGYLPIASLLEGAPDHMPPAASSRDRAKVQHRDRPQVDDEPDGVLRSGGAYPNGWNPAITAHPWMDSLAAVATRGDRNQSITAIVRQYVDLIGNGTADEMIAMFAEQASVEDPVGTEIRTDRAAIHAFFSNLENLDRSSELLTLRVSGNEAAFQFALTFTAGDATMRLSPIDTMTFDESDKITSVRSYFSPTDFEPVQR